MQTPTNLAPWIGLAAAIVVGALEQVVGSGLITGSGLDVLNLLITVIPLVAGLLTKRYTTSNGIRLLGRVG